MMTIAPLVLSLVLRSPGALPPTDFKSTWSSVKQSISTRYYGRTANKARMDSLLAKYEPEAEKATTPNEFAAVVNRMIADFGDSHFGLFTKSDQGFYLMDGLARRNAAQEMPNIGAWFKPAGDGYTIQMLFEGSSAAEAGLRKGDVVTKINGQPFTPVDSLASKVGEHVKLTYTRGGKQSEAQVEVNKSPELDTFLDATKNSVRVIESGGKKIGYIHVWTMASDDFRNALANAVYGKLKDTDGFILDIRDGFGGRPEGFGDPFFRPDVRLDWDMGGFVNHQLFGYQRPLVVLINRGSRSAKEVFAYIMKNSHRATLVGETTAGNVLGTSPMAISDWGYLEIPMVDVITDGVRLEKNGVKPDVPVAREFDDAGKDLYIEQALKVLSTATAKRG